MPLGEPLEVVVAALLDGALVLAACAVLVLPAGDLPRLRLLGEGVERVDSEAELGRDVEVAAEVRRRR